MKKVENIPVPRSVDSQLPNPYRPDNQKLYVSFARFKCPDNCSEPNGICSYTRKARLGTLYKSIADLSEPDYNILVLRNFQIAPGVSGYPIAHLIKAYKQVIEFPGNYLVSTSCSCHGILDAFYIS